MTGLTESFMIPYALALGASVFQAGLLSSFRNFVLALAQLKAADAVRWCRSRRALVLWTACAQALAWIPLAVAGPLFGPWAVPALILLYTVGTTSAAVGGPAWGSLVSEYLTPEARGRFFGHRARLLGGWTAAGGLVAGGVLQLASARPLVGFGLLCGAAAVSRAVSCYWLTHLTEGPWREPREARFSFWQFIRQARTSNFAQFALCMGLLGFAVNLASPYMAVYMLEELRYGYLTYTWIVLAGSVMACVSATWWGAVADRLGNWAVLRWTMFGVVFLPPLWSVWAHPAWLFVLNLLGGTLWGGLNLAMVNFVYDAATPQKRTRCLAYFNMLNGCGVGLGALAGGWLLTRLAPLGGSPFVTLFVVSGLLRLAMAVVFRMVVHEVRPIRQTGLREVLYDLMGQRVIQVLGLLSGPPEVPPAQEDRVERA
jgi:MFS family permease